MFLVLLTYTKPLDVVDTYVPAHREYLARNAGRVIGRAELCEHVWDANHDPFSNAIEVYINRLRKKVDESGGTQLIHTRRGAGYLLAADEADGGGVTGTRTTVRRDEEQRP